MINILKTPPANSVLLDANNSVISIQSTLGAGHYFRALIYINDVLFDTQGWSRQDDFIAKKDLKKLYAAYFTSTFNPIITTGLLRQTDFIKKVNITINEYVLETDLLVETIYLPVFLIMHNQVPESFSDETKIQFLDVKPEVIQVTENSKIVLPFFVNANSEDLLAKIYSGNTIINQIMIPSLSGKKAYCYNLDLNTISIPYGVDYLNLEISCGNNSISKTFKFFILPNYPVKEIVFKNNFGFYIHSYFDGEIEVNNDFKVDSYTQIDGTDKIFEINENATYSINTGSLMNNEKSIISQICNSIDTYFLYENQWIEILTKTKKWNEFKDNIHSFKEDLLFSFSKNRDIKNKEFIAVENALPPVVPVDPLNKQYNTNHYNQDHYE
jgi:hypothetical protein